MRIVTAVSLALALAGCSAGQHTTPATTTTITVTQPPIVTAPPPLTVTDISLTDQLHYRTHPGEVVGSYRSYVDAQFWVRNDTNVPLTFDPASQRLRDHQGRLYAPELHLAAGPGCALWGQVTINPGNVHFCDGVPFEVTWQTHAGDYDLVFDGGSA